MHTTVSLDHVHLLSRDPLRAAAWYVDMLGCKMLKEIRSHGAPQIYLSFGDAMLIIRGRRNSEREATDPTPGWGVEHFGFRVTGGYDALCEGLKRKDVRFLMEPVDINAGTRAAFVQGPDGVTIELLERRDWPELRHFGADAGAPIPPNQPPECA
jgi:lactoylglutathione lyase